jgi:hypothetical protein
MEVISALQSVYVQRLKHTWKGVEKKDIALFNELVDQMDFVGHFKKVSAAAGQSCSCCEYCI